MSFTADILKACKQSGLMLEPAATQRLNAYLAAQLANEDRDADFAAYAALVRGCLLAVLSKVKESPLQSSKLTAVQVDTAVAALNAAASGEASASKLRVIDVIGAFEQPRHHYDAVKRVFYEVTAERTKFGVAEERADMLRSRYALLLQRLQRRPEFQLSKGGSSSSAAAAGGDGMDDDEEQMPLSTIESLLGQTGKKCIFGQLCQLTEGVFSLEDIHSSIVVDLRSPSLLQSAGLFTEGCFVVCEGETRDDGVFAVSALISPPPERKMVTVKVHPALDWLGADLSAATSASAAASGGGSVGGGSAEAQLKLKLLRSPQHANDMIVVLSDVFLDLPRTLVRLATLLEGLRTASPQAFVFMGNFTSTPSSNAPGQMARLKAHFDALADVLLKFPSLCREAHFVFIPGPRDLPASLGDVLPSPPLPAFLTQRLRERLAHVTCATNPARLSWVNKELLLFREDLLHRMRRACVRPPAEAESADNSQHLVRTLIDQAHLCPLPMERRPIYWNHDHALRMYPLPDALVLADSVDPYEHKYAGVHALNPGSFGNDGAFVIYYPARGESERVIEFSKTADAAAASAH